MAVSTIVQIVSEVGDNIKVAFDFSFKVFVAADVVAIKETAADVFAVGVLGVDYTLVFDTDAETGTVTWMVAPGAGLRSIIYRDSAETQGTNFPREDTIPAKQTENALDKLTLIAQDLLEMVDRAALQPVAPATPAKVVIEAPVESKGVFWTFIGGEWRLRVTTDDIDGAATAAAASAVAAAASAAAALVSETNAAASAVAAAAVVSELTGTLAARPAAPATSIQYYADDTDELYRFSVAANRWFLIG